MCKNRLGSRYANIYKESNNCDEDAYTYIRGVNNARLKSVKELRAKFIYYYKRRESLCAGTHIIIPGGWCSRYCVMMQEKAQCILQERRIATTNHTTTVQKGKRRSLLNWKMSKNDYSICARDFLLLTHTQRDVVVVCIYIFLNNIMLITQNDYK